MTESARVCTGTVPSSCAGGSAYAGGIDAASDADSARAASDANTIGPTDTPRNLTAHNLAARVFDGPTVELMDMLDARERRAVCQHELLAEAQAGEALLSFTLSIPGPCKTSAALEAAFIALEGAVLEALDGTEVRRTCRLGGATGPELIMLVALPALELKRRMIAVERKHPLGRLADLDVFASPLDEGEGSGGCDDPLGHFESRTDPSKRDAAHGTGEQSANAPGNEGNNESTSANRASQPLRPIERTELGEPARTCLICGKPAKECARSRTHSVQDMQDTIAKLMYQGGYL